MFRLDRICLTNSGISRVRITMVRPAIDSAHVQPLSLPKTGDSTACHPTRIADTAWYSGVMTALKI